MHVNGTAYFDESGSGSDALLPGYYGVAGFVGPDGAWDIFNSLWRTALADADAPYLHMREFAHSTGAFAGWGNDKSRRELLMQGVVKAVRESELSAFGAAMKAEDFDALTEDERSRCVSPYFCCLQDVLWGFALATWDEPPVSLRVIGDRTGENEGKAKLLFKALRRQGAATPLPAPAQDPNESLFLNFVDELEFGNSRDTYGLQAADLLVYEMVKELRNQDVRPEDRMRWPLDQILGDPESPFRKGLKFNTGAMLKAQVMGKWAKQRPSVLATDLDETLRILRGKSEPFKRRLQASEPKE